MKGNWETAKRWFGLLLSVILLLETSGIQALAAEEVVLPMVEEEQPISGTEEEIIVTDVSVGDITAGDVGQWDVTCGDVTEGDVTGSDVQSLSTELAAEQVASGTYYGMDWAVDAAGLLTISGTYTGVWGSKDVKWSTNNAENIITAKVTATGVTSTKEWFRALPNLQKVDFSEFDASQVTKMYWMFIGCASLKEVDLSKFADARITDLSYMFQNCTSLTKVNFGNLDTSKVTDMSCMFMGCSALESLDLSSFDTSSVKNMSNMFYKCTKLSTLDISSFHTQNVTTMNRMFGYCQALAELDLPYFNTSNVTDMGEMFYGCEKLERLNLSGFDMAKVTKASTMLDGCEGLEELWSPKNLTLDVALDISLMSEDETIYSALPKARAESIHLIRLKAYGDYYGVKWYLTNSGKLTITGIYGKGFGNTLWSDYKDDIVTVEANPSGMTGMKGWFQNHTKLKSVDFTGIDTGAVTDMENLFYGCTSLESVNIDVFDTGKTKYMERMFYNCESLKVLDFSKMSTEELLLTDDMLTGCSSLEDVYCFKNLTDKTEVLLPVTLADSTGKKYTTMPIGQTESIRLQKILAEGTYCGMNWWILGNGQLEISGAYGKTADTDVHWRDYKDLVKNVRVTATGVTNTYHWFNNMTNLQSADFSAFDTSKVFTMEETFYGCTALKKVDLSNVNTANVNNMNRMFYNCSGLTELDLSSFDMSAVATAENMLYGCSAVKQIKIPRNLALDVALPVVFSNGKGGIIKTLPKNMAESVTLNTPFASGVWCQMDWIVEHDGMLYICGAYGKKADTDTIWKDYASQVIGVKITATGVTNTYHWFNNMTKLETADLSEFDSSKVITMNEMFYNCSALKELDASNLDTSKVTNTYGMFYNCTALTKLDMSSCDFGAVTEASEMLYGCTSLGYIKTPKNLQIDIALAGELEDKDRNIYTQLPKNLEESIVLTHVIYRIAPIADQVYTGKAIKPAVVVYKGNHILTEGVDYTVSYKNNTNAAMKDAKKAPAVTVKGKTGYIGTLTATFTILPKQMNTHNVVTTPTIVAKNGKMQKFKSAVTVDGKKLTLNKDYKIIYTDTSENAYKEPNRYQVDIQGINNYTGTVPATLIILDKEQVQASKLKISKLPTCPYVEGEPAMPVPVVSYKGKELVRDVDYEIIYTDNHKAGKASLTIRGLENVAEDGVYVVGIVTKTFTIKGTAISKAKADYQKTFYYTGEEIYPAVTVKHGEITLCEGTDYTLEYSKNVKVGTGTITIKGCGGYTGTTKKTFKIVADPAVAERMTVAFVGGEAVAAYHANGAKPEVVVKLEGTVLESGKDYTVSYKNNKKIPAADVAENKLPAVVIKGKGNYKFTKTVYFNIVACPVEELTVTAADKFLGDKKGYLSAPVVKDGTKTLKKGKDYEIVSYKTADGAEFTGKEEVANDTYVTVTVRGIGNYTGEESVTYRIATKSMAKVKITAKSLAYNEGKPVIYIGQDIKDGLLVLQDNKTKETLQYGRDYKIIGYTNNTKVGTATVTIVGCGEYGGTRTVKFKIVKYKLR